MGYVRHIIEVAIVVAFAVGAAGGAMVYVLSRQPAATVQTPSKPCNCGGACKCVHCRCCNGCNCKQVKSND